MESFQEIIFKLKSYWAARGCIIQEPYDVEVGAGTMCPETFLRVLGPKPYRVAYVQPSRRPADGRYGENPNRLYKHSQLQVIPKPSPDDVIEQYLGSLEAVGIDVRLQDEVQFSVYNFEMADVETLWKLFDLHEGEAARLLAAYPKSEEKARFPLLPAYDQVLKCSNVFNTLDARGAISVTERVGVIQRVRKLAIGVAQAWAGQQGAGQ